MARASYKKDLVNDAVEGYVAVMDIVESMSKEEQEGTFPFEDRDHNVRDVLVHLHEWQNMMEKWYTVGCIEKGTPVVPREGYTWRTIPEMNQMIWKQYQGTSLEEAKAMLKKSHDTMLELIERHSNEELFARNMFSWTGDTVLGSYFVSATASHYEWALKKLKKYKRTL